MITDPNYKPQYKKGWSGKGKRGGLFMGIGGIVFWILCVVRFVAKLTMAVSEFSSPMYIYIHLATTYRCIGGVPMSKYTNGYFYSV